MTKLVVRCHNVPAVCLAHMLFQFKGSEVLYVQNKISPHLKRRCRSLGGAKAHPEDSKENGCNAIIHQSMYMIFLYFSIDDSQFQITHPRNAQPKFTTLIAARNAEEADSMYGPLDISLGSKSESCNHSPLRLSQLAHPLERWPEHSELLKICSFTSVLGRIVYVSVDCTQLSWPE